MEDLTDEEFEEVMDLLDEWETEDDCYDEAERVGMYKTPFGWM